jgi:arylsulfatase
MPILTNLRADPFEEAPHESMMHFEWFARNPFAVYPAGPIIAQFLGTLKDYPPSQRGGNFVPMAMAEGANAEQMAEAAAEDQRLKDLNTKGLKSLQDDYDAVARITLSLAIKRPGAGRRSP